MRAFGAGDVQRAGGKGANLGELIRAGYRVPDGFVITTDAYANVVEQSGLSPMIREQIAPDGSPVEAHETVGAALRAALAGTEVPEHLRLAIVRAYASLGGGPVAVRSSATAEDLPGAAFAGQQDTFLNVVGEDAVVDAVRHCWASLWNARAIAYRRRRDIASADGGASPDVRIAVVVQSMVDAEAAGVMLTANPVTGDRDEIVVDASGGLGEAVVSGSVTPDHYVVDRDGHVRESRLDRDVVPPAILVELAELGTRIADHFGRPQDIEWAYADGSVWLLQARPMTALPPPPLRLNRIQRITGKQFIEMLPIRPYPIDMSAWILPGLGRMVSRMLDEMAGLRLDFADVLPERDGVVERFIPPSPRPSRRVLTAPIRNAGRIRRCDPARWTHDPRFDEFQRRIKDIGARDLNTLTWPELCRTARETLDAVDVITDLRIDYLPRAGISLVRLRVMLKLIGLIKLFPLLILGAHTRTTDANRALEGLADHVRADAALRARFDELDADTLAEEIRRQPSFTAFSGALDGYLHEYGHRETTSPLLVTAPTWRESPATVVGVIKALVDERAEPLSTAQADAATQRVLEHPVVRRLRARAVVSRAIDAARAAIALREDSHFYGTQTLPILRMALLELGRRLATVGVVDHDEDAFHLRLEELEGIADPATMSQAEADRVRRIADRRAATRDELSGVPLIATATLFAPPGDETAIVAGTPASGGRVTGPVRVIREPAEFGRLRTGDILVCPYTNPAWTPLFQRAAAVVVDTGGLGSHAAIVAREYGIPTIMGTGTGTSSLVDDQIVTVDGDHGRVVPGNAD